jgi:hypothetical protein
LRSGKREERGTLRRYWFSFILFTTNAAAPDGTPPRRIRDEKRKNYKKIFLPGRASKNLMGLLSFILMTFRVVPYHSWEPVRFLKETPVSGKEVSAGLWNSTPHAGGLMRE